MKFSKKITLPLMVFLLVSSLLSVIQIKMKHPMLLLERFFPGGGWIEILLVALFGAFVVSRMTDPGKSAYWRRKIWLIYSVWFFMQLGLGIMVSDIFLLTGKLHLPVPAMMLAGPLYRGEKSFMTILFLTTIVLTGPAWCSQLCYFGGIDNSLSKGKTIRKPFKNKFLIKNSVLLLVIAGALSFRLFNMPPLGAAIAGIVLGVVGLTVILYFSRRQHRMVHCTLFCPIGTLVHYLKYINPFRMEIDHKCDLCLACTPKCKYDALNLSDIRNKKPGLTCTLCGDCIYSCKSNSIQYRFFKMKPDNARNLYLVVTITVFMVFLAMGRI